MQRVKTFVHCATRRQLALFLMVACIAASLASCRRDIEKRELLSNHEVMTYGDLFTVFWNGMNSNYLFWDKDPTNWDEMYRVYKPKFDSLDLRLYSDTTQNMCFQYMADMTRNIQDGQYGLALWQGGDYSFEDSLFKGYISFVPKLIRTQKIHAALPDTLFDYIIQNNYLTNFDYGLYRASYSAQIFQITSGRISKGAKDILYTNVNTFAMKEAYEATYGSRPSRPVIKNIFDNVRKGHCDAIIIDLRNNRGGNLQDIDFLVGQFTSKPFLFGYARYKSGSGRLDYTAPLPMNITPQAGANDFKKPIVILADVYSAALCEAVIQAFKALPEAKVTVIGERTYGAAGMLAGNDISTNGGSFDMASFASARMSNAALMDKNRNINFNGIQPDIEVKYSDASISQMLATGIDIQLEKAIRYLNQ